MLLPTRCANSGLADLSRSARRSSFRAFFSLRADTGAKPLLGCWVFPKVNELRTVVNKVLTVELNVPVGGLTAVEVGLGPFVAGFEGSECNLGA